MKRETPVASKYVVGSTEFELKKGPDIARWAARRTRFVSVGQAEVIHFWRNRIELLIQSLHSMTNLQRVPGGRNGASAASELKIVGAESEDGRVSDQTGDSETRSLVLHSGT